MGWGMGERSGARWVYLGLLAGHCTGTGSAEMGFDFSEQKMTIHICESKGHPFAAKQTSYQDPQWDTTTLHLHPPTWR